MRASPDLENPDAPYCMFFKLCLCTFSFNVVSISPSIFVTVVSTIVITVVSIVFAVRLSVHPPVRSPLWATQTHTHRSFSLSQTSLVLEFPFSYLSPVFHVIDLFRRGQNLQRERDREGEIDGWMDVFA